MELVLNENVASIKLSRPPANALSYELVADLETALTGALEADATVIVFTSGLQAFFAAGADLKLLGSASPAEFADYLQTLRSFIERVASLSLPTVASVHGMALGGGLELALACTFRIAARSALLGLPEVKLGLLPGAGGTQRLPRLVGRAAALDLLLSGRSVDAAHALAIGLVDQIHPDDELAVQTDDFARSLASGPKQAIAGIIHCIEVADAHSLTAGMEVERDLVLSLFDTRDAHEGIAAFVEKRQPSFD